MRLLSRIEVLERIGISLSSWYRLRSAGTFPPPVRFRHTRAALFRARDVERWLALNPRSKKL